MLVPLTGFESPLGCGTPSILLNENSISGTLPSSLGTLRSPRTFYCGDGSIASKWPSTDGVDYCSGDTSRECPCGDCCDCGCQMPVGLERLFLQHNSISGTLPPSLGNVETGVHESETSNEREAQSVGAFHARLTGRLREIELSANSVSGTLPPELANLTSLAMLRLSENRISGTIPDAIRANESTPDGEGGLNPHQVEGASALRVLTLTNNLLSGSVPPSLAECSALDHLQWSLIGKRSSPPIPIYI